MAGGEKGIGNFFGDVVREMKRVSWPTRKELTRYTIVVVTTVLIMSIFFALVDLGISNLIKLIIN